MINDFIARSIWKCADTASYLKIHGPERIVNPENIDIPEDIQDAICNHADVACSLLNIDLPDIEVTKKTILTKDSKPTS